MGNFNIISFTELTQGGNSNVGMGQQDIRTTQEAQTPSNGVYIQDTNGKLWKTADWDYSAKPNAIAVITKETKFLIALSQSAMRLSNSDHTPLESYMFETSFSRVAKGDYNGVGNTANILKAQPNASFAAGYCNAFIFPDGKTKGFLPSLGQLNLAYQNKSAVDAALKKCGGTEMTAAYYWSSTFWGVYCGYCRCWELNWSDGGVFGNHLGGKEFVRPFANF